RDPHAGRPPPLPRVGDPPLPRRDVARRGIARGDRPALPVTAICRVGHPSRWPTLHFGRQVRTTTNNRLASQATLPLTRATPEPRPAVALRRSIVVSSSRVSPGTTCARKRALSMPPNR